MSGEDNNPSKNMEQNMAFSMLGDEELQTSLDESCSQSAVHMDEKSSMAFSMLSDEEMQIPLNESKGESVFNIENPPGMAFTIFDEADREAIDILQENFNNVSADSGMAFTLFSREEKVAMSYLQTKHGIDYFPINRIIPCSREMQTQIEESKDILDRKDVIENSCVNNSSVVDIQGINTSTATILTLSEQEFEGGNFEITFLSVVHKVAGNNNSADVEIFYRFKVVSRFGTNITLVSKSKVSDFEWVKEAAYGLAYMNESKIERKFASYISAIIERDLPMAKQEILFSSTGWKIVFGKAIYVSDSGVVGNVRSGVCSEAGYRLESAQELVGTRLGAEEFLRMQRIIKRPHIGRALSLFSVMSVVTSVFELAHYPIQFLTALIGTTNSFKTSTALVFSRIFNASSQERAEISFTSTIGGIEKAMAKIEDALLLIDDFYPADEKSESKELDRKLKLVCRAYGDRVPKQRMTDFCKSDMRAQYPVRGCCLITGELFRGIQSSQLRVFLLELSRGDVDTDWLSYYQKERFVLPSFIEGFISFVTPRFQDYVKKIEIQKAMYRKIEGFTIPRFRDVYAQFCIVADMLCEYLSTLGIVENFNEWKESIFCLLMQQQEHLADNDVTKNMAEAIMERVVQSGTINVDNVTNGYESYVIFEDKNHYYIKADGLLQIVQDYYKNRSKYFPLDKDQMIVRLREAELIETKTNKNGIVESSRKLKQSRGNHARYLYIIKDKIIEFLK